jgi:hypothetical protein
MSMSSRNPGDRVGAMSHADQTTVHMFGYGVFLGDLLCPVGPFGTTLDEYRAASLRLGLGEPPPYTNPCIRLDDGRYVWGHECWWCSEKGIRETINGRVVVAADPSNLAPLELPNP